LESFRIDESLAWWRSPSGGNKACFGARYSPFRAKWLAVFMNGISFPMFQVMFENSLASGTGVGVEESLEFNFMFGMDSGLYTLDEGVMG
jgi:hypothetical protein